MEDYEVGCTVKQDGLALVFNHLELGDGDRQWFISLIRIGAGEYTGMIQCPRAWQPTFLD